MSLKQIDLLLYVWLLINAIGWFGFLALPRLRKSLSCKEKADGIVEDIVETQNTKGQPLFHAVVRYQAGLASYACETANKTNAVWKKGEPAIVYYQNSKPGNAFVKNVAWTGKMWLSRLPITWVLFKFCFFICSGRTSTYVRADLLEFFIW